jgi:hypothetical protein
MKTLDFLTKNAIAAIIVLFLTDCGGATTKEDTSSDNSSQTQSENFSIKLSKNFYSYDDYSGYIVATVISGSISTGQEVEGVKNEDFADRTPMRVTEIKNSGGSIVQSAKTGEEVTLTFKTTSGKNISMSFNGVEYSIVKKGLNPEAQPANTTQASVDTNTCIAKLSIDGQNWQGENCDNQFWVNGNSITKKGPFMLLKFTRANEKMSTKSEYFMIQVNTNSKAPKSYSGKDLEVSFQGYVADKEVYYGRVPSDKQNLSLNITSFEESHGNAKITGKLSGKLKRITCANCKDEVAVDLNFDIAAVRIYTEK